MALEDILKVQETVQQGDMRDKLAMMSPQQPSTAPSMPPQQPPMPPQQPPMASQMDIKQDLNDMLTATMADGDSLAAKALEGLIKKTVDKKTIGEIYEEVKATKYLRKMGIKVKEFTNRIPTDLELQEIEDDLDKWLDNTEYDTYTSSSQVFTEFTNIDEDDIV